MCRGGRNMAAEIFAVCGPKDARQSLRTPQNHGHGKDTQHGETEEKHTAKAKNTVKVRVDTQQSNSARQRPRHIS
jgi:hypothetical protein